MPVGLVGLLILGLLVFGVLSIMVWESRSRVRKDLHLGVGDISASIGKLLPLLVGVILAIILYKTVGLPDLKQSDIDIGFWIALLVVVALAIASLFFKTGGVAGSIAVWLVVGGLIMLLIFGDNISEVRIAVKKAATSTVIKSKDEQNTQPSSNLPVVIKAEWEGGVPVVGQWSRVFDVPAYCWIDPGPDVGISFRMRYRLDGEDEWHEYDRKTKGMRGNQIQFMLLKSRLAPSFTMGC